MLKIKKSPTADTRTCDVTQVKKEELLKASTIHIRDVGLALGFFCEKIIEAAVKHDYDKLTEIDWFYSDFKTGFKETSWWDNHRKIHRHHLGQEDGIPENVNLIDILEYISDCVMAGMARSGEVFDLEITDELLSKAFKNTVILLKNQVIVE